MKITRTHNESSLFCFRQYISSVCLLDLDLIYPIHNQVRRRITDRLQILIHRAPLIESRLSAHSLNDLLSTEELMFNHGTLEVMAQSTALYSIYQNNVVLVQNQIVHRFYW